MSTRAGLAGVDARTRLREAALECLGRNGLAETSTRDIIAAAGQRNPSAISYHFGSKARLIADLLREVNRDQSAIVQQQVAVARESPGPAPDRWVAVAVDAAVGLLGTERGCLLVRLWAEVDEQQPDAVEEFLTGDHGLARAWRDAAAATFPELAPTHAVARGVVLLRTLQWITVRAARRRLAGDPPSCLHDPIEQRAFLLELGRNIVLGPTGAPPAHPVE
jgi:AcrR family transcriptional regulator